MADATAPVDPAARPQLGFGCSNLGSDLDYHASCALVEAAYDAGFRHFDVAPSYGLGQAERVLGDVLHDVRESVCVVTKAGIAHPRGVTPLGKVKQILRPIKRMFPALWARGAQQVRNASAARGQFGASQVRSSLSLSRERLRTPTVDWLLLHEVTPDELTDELLDALRAAQLAGELKGFGLGTTISNTQRILTKHPTTFGMVQVNHFWGAGLKEFDAVACRATHRVIHDGMTLIGLPEFQQFLKNEPTLATLWASLRSESSAADLLLAASLQSHGPTHVLVASSKVDRVRHFMEVARSGSHAELAAQLTTALHLFYQPRHAPPNQSTD